jgi:hypothetical protein
MESLLLLFMVMSGAMDTLADVYPTVTENVEKNVKQTCPTSIPLFHSALALLPRTEIALGVVNNA